jgi:microtubule-associated protein-like 6
MGCGASRGTNYFKAHLLHDKDLTKEATACHKTKAIGVSVENIKTHQTLSKDNPCFLEELTEHGEETDNVKPWLANIVPPEFNMKENKDVPPYKLKIQHVFGFRSYDVRENLFFKDNDNIIYMTGSVGIVQNIHDLSQNIFGGLELSENGECHDDDIVSISYFKGEVSMIATGQREHKPTILIWSPTNPRVIYARFHQKKGSKEVSSLEFDKKGNYIASVGKDDMHHFYVFDIQNKNLYWSEESGPNVIFDLEFNPLGDEFVLVGIKIVMFCYISKKLKKNSTINKMELSELTFTSTNYTEDGICFTATSNGNIYAWKECLIIKSIKITEGSIPNLSFSDNRLYVSDNKNFVYIVNPDNLKIDTKFQMSSVVKAMDINDNGDIALGLKDGTIVIKNLQKKTERIIVRSHHDGRLFAIEFVPDRFILSSGEDNKILLYDINSKTCEYVGIINEKPEIIKDDKGTDLDHNEYAPNQCSKSITYNMKYDHVAVGLNNGCVSIRKGIRNLNMKYCNDIKIGEKSIEVVKYSPNNQLLACSSLDLQFKVCTIENYYAVVYRLSGHESGIFELDWDVNSKFMQSVTIDNNYLLYDLKTEKVIPGKLLF